MAQGPGHLRAEPNVPRRVGSVRHAAPPATETPAASENTLLSHAIVSLVATKSCPYVPLVLVGPSFATEACLEEISLVWQRRAARPIASGPAFVRDDDHRSSPLLLDETALARDLDQASGDGLHRVHERWTSRGLLLIHGIEDVASPVRLASLAGLLDRVAERGGRVVVTLTQPPESTKVLGAAVASRLLAGLVIAVREPLPTREHRDPADSSPTDSSGRAVTIRRVISRTARHFGLVADDLVGPSRRKTVAHARGMAMYLARYMTGASLAAIGRSFGGRDHTTVMHGIRVTTHRARARAAVAEELSKLSDTILTGRPGARRHPPPGCEMSVRGQSVG